MVSKTVRNIILVGIGLLGATILGARLIRAKKEEVPPPEAIPEASITNVGVSDFDKFEPGKQLVTIKFRVTNTSTGMRDYEVWIGEAGRVQGGFTLGAGL